MGKMRKQRLYLDSSYISHLNEPAEPIMMAHSLQLWAHILDGDYDIVLSRVVFDELARCQEPKLSLLMDFLKRIKYAQVEPSDDLINLASKFIEFGVLTSKSVNDCRHIAAALMSSCDIVVSWNFHHMVNAKTIRGTKVISASEGFKDIIICTPTMLVSGDFDNE